MNYYTSYVTIIRSHDLFQMFVMRCICDERIFIFVAPHDPVGLSFWFSICMKLNFIILQITESELKNINLFHNVFSTIPRLSPVPAGLRMRRERCDCRTQDQAREVCLQDSGLGERGVHCRTQTNNNDLLEKDGGTKNCIYNAS